MSTPAFFVIEATSEAGRALKLMALAYSKDDSFPEFTNFAPFKNKSPSDLQFHFFHSFSDAFSRLVTCYKNHVRSFTLLIFDYDTLGGRTERIWGQKRVQGHKTANLKNYNSMGMTV